MKAFLKILVGGFVLFMVLAMLEEREVFIAWLAPGVDADPPALETSVPPGVEPTLRTYLAVLAHLYASGGDPRFADRLPATAEVIDEALSDIAYLKHNRRLQRMSLMKLELADVNQLGEDAVLVTCIEYWVIRTVSRDTGGDVQPVRSERLHMEYILERDHEGWRVRGWQLLPSATAEDAAGVLEEGAE